MNNYSIRQGINIHIMNEVFNRLFEAKKLTKQKLRTYFI
jgi:hypothetical protein